ncbi:hypothetical protein ACIQVO_35680 [Streptomyces sp. NPDC101062]|uniref:hypothetical protein n=1 Tax=unclassified Streptomyces TaxID=2593676 RepID=UPI003813539A
MTTTWAYDGKPLYTFLKDKRPGATVIAGYLVPRTVRRTVRCDGALHLADERMGGWAR